AMSTMRAPATTVIAVAPIDTQYGGVNSSGRMPYSSSRTMMTTPTTPYRNTPIAHDTTASIARAWRQSTNIGCSVAARTATAWLPTTQMNHVPLAADSTEPLSTPSSAVQGMR